MIIANSLTWIQCRSNDFDKMLTLLRLREWGLVVDIHALLETTLYRLELPSLHTGR